MKAQATWYIPHSPEIVQAPVYRQVLSYSVRCDPRGILPRLCACSVQLLPSLTHSRRALSASAAQLTAPVISLALDQRGRSEQPVAR